MPSTMLRDNDDKVNRALDTIFSVYGDECSVIKKRKNLLKFGRNAGLGTSPQTVWNLGGNETYISSNLIDTISSSSGSDTQAVKVEGHTLANDQFTFVVQDATLDGQNKVVLDTPLARCSRIYNNGSTDFVGDIYGYQDQSITNGVPGTTALIHAKAVIGDNSTQKASTTLSNLDYALITSITVSVLEKNSAFADFSLQIREYGKVFRTVARISANSAGGGTQLNFDPYIIAPKNSDIRIVAEAGTTNVDVAAQWQSMLASVHN